MEPSPNQHDTWLAPQVVERYGDRELVHDINLSSFPVRVGRAPQYYEGESNIIIGTIAPPEVRDRISRCQATIRYTNGAYMLKDGNGYSSNLGVHWHGKIIENPIPLQPGIKQLYLVPKIGAYSCQLRWLQSESLEGDSSALETLGARNAYLESELGNKQQQLAQLTSDTYILQEQVRSLQEYSAKDKLLTAQQDKRIEKLTEEQKRTKRLWRILGTIVVIILFVLFGFDTDVVVKAIQGVVLALTAFGLIQTKDQD